MLLSQMGAQLGSHVAKRACQRSNTVLGDWSAWLPEEMDQLFGATRSELECSNVILSVALDEAIARCDQEQFTVVQERALAFAELFDHLATRIRLVIRTIQEHGSHFGTLPNVAALIPANFRGATAQRVSSKDNFLARILFGGRTRFFHKLNALSEIIEELQREARAVVQDISGGAALLPDKAWSELEILAYDLSTCMGETTVVLKSFFCALPAEELDAFRQKLVTQVPALLTVIPRRT
jgi:hypothetical protein